MTILVTMKEQVFHQSRYLHDENRVIDKKEVSTVVHSMGLNENAW